MDTTQQVFYIIGSVALGLLALFLIVAIAFVFFVQKRLAMASKGLALFLRGAVISRGLRSILGLIRRR